MQQFYELRGAPPEIHVPVEPDDREALESWLSERAGRRVRIVVPQRGEKRGLVDLANRNAALAYQTRFNQTTAAQYDALETLQPVLALPALPRRIECFDISTIQGSETVASMVVCEDGRMRRGGVSEVPHPRGRRARGRSSSGSPSRQRLSSTTSPPCTRSSLRRYRKRARAGRAVSGSDPDRRRQGAAVGRVRRARGTRPRQPGGGRHREEGGAAVHARPRRADRAARPTIRRCCSLQRIRDEAHRFAVTFHRRARTMRDLRSELDDVPGIGPRRRRTLLTTFGSLAGVRRATREELAAVVGAKVGRCRPCVFRRVGLNLVYSLLDIDFAQVFIAFIVLLFSLTVHEIGARVDGRSARRSRRRGCSAACRSIRSCTPISIGTVAVSAARASIGGVPLIGWAKPVPVNVAPAAPPAPRLRAGRRGRPGEQPAARAWSRRSCCALRAGLAGDARRAERLGARSRRC